MAITNRQNDSAHVIEPSLRWSNKLLILKPIESNPHHAVVVQISTMSMMSSLKCPLASEFHGPQVMQEFSKIYIP